MSDRIRADIEARWVVELNCECPGCGENVDLLELPDFWDGRDLALAENRTERSDNLEVECPECGHEFNVCCVW